jgi:hypothetical protein
VSFGAHGDNSRALFNLRAEAESDCPAVRTVYLAAFPDHGKVGANLVDDLREP